MQEEEQGEEEQGTRSKGRGAFERLKCHKQATSRELKSHRQRYLSNDTNLLSRTPTTHYTTRKHKHKHTPSRQ